MERSGEIVDTIDAAGISRRQLLKIIATGGALGVLAACTGGHPNATPSHTESSTQTPSEQPTNTLAPEQTPKSLMIQAGETLLALHQTDPQHPGWRFKSEIQAPHYQTDRDVGAASVGMGFLTLAENDPRDPRWLEGAEQTAHWLMAVSKQDGQGGRFWPDYVDDHDTSGDAYTSFDDGAIGIGDFFWQLYAKTGKEAYKQVALESVQWTFSQAENVDGTDMYRWLWNAHDPGSAYEMGMGEGSVGIIHALATYYERTKDSDPAFAQKCKQYAEGAERYLESARTAMANKLGKPIHEVGIPETAVIGRSDGDTNMNSGYLSGSAGGAFMYLKLYQVFDDKRYLSKAAGLLSWLQNTTYGPMVEPSGGTVTWKLALDPKGGNDEHYATGFEEGNAGIGWTFLQAYKVTGDENYLTTAKQAANWLLEVGLKSGVNELSWHEDEHEHKGRHGFIHTNLNNGTAGNGMFLKDLYLVTGDARYQAGAQAAFNGIVQSAKTDKHGHTYWTDKEIDDNGKPQVFSKDPSWHWGLAGIIEFAARMGGSTADIPGEQPGLMKP